MPMDRLVLGLGLLAALQTADSALADDGEVDFKRRIAPVLARRCLECHNPIERKGGLDLSTKESLLRGGDSGPIVLPGRVDDSLLWERIRRDEMPPERRLPADEKQLLARWISAGASWGGGPIDPYQYSTDRRAGYDWWALQPLQENWDDWMVEQSDLTGDLAQNPIDLFVLGELKRHGLSFAPLADRRRLYRRLSFDLLGLPPEEDKIQAFERDESPTAYSSLVSRLLASPHYGERWARHWLDLARFGESAGFERDKLRSDAWRYRDWVIDALNQDLPYDRFVRWQLAGDVVAPDSSKGVIATGFLVAGPYDEVGQNQQSAAMKAVVRQDELEDLVSVVGQTFLGLTINCARCHDHKFDPIRQSEYYQLTAALSGVRHGQRKLSDPSWRATSQETARGLAARIRYAEQRASRTAADNLRQQLQFEIEQLQSQQARLVEETIYAVTPKAAEVVHVLLRGNPAAQGDVVAAGGVNALVGVDADFGLATDAADAPRRKQLADWVTHRRNPLFARVIVNRLWHYHFGVGLVETPNDFGFNGGRPSHPLLLDWLASELIRHDWSLKAIQRLIVTSHVYRQSSQFDQAGNDIDAENRLLWRKTPLRLDAETIRDAILTVSGELNRRLHGPGYHDFRTFNFNSQFYEMQDLQGSTFNRRSLYRTWVRSGRNSFLDVFDCPDPSAKAPRRAVTTTPLQALALQNDPFVMRMAARFAERIHREAGKSLENQVTLAYQLAFSREPTSSELAATVRFARDHDLSSLCRVLFNTAEFLYVD